REMSSMQFTALGDWLSSQEGSFNIHVAAAFHEVADDEQRQVLEASLFATPRACLRWAGEIYTPPSILEALARRDEARLNLRLARHPRTPGSSLLRILRVSDDPGILAALAAHPNSPAQLLRDLPWGQQPPIRSGLAGNPACPLDLLYAILPETTMVDRKRMAAHPAADGA